VTLLWLKGGKEREREGDGAAVCRNEKKTEREKGAREADAG